MNTKISDKKYTNRGNRNILSNVPFSANYILDVGCGAGDIAKILFANGKILDGITISESEAKLAQEFCRSVVIHDLAYGLPLQINNKYDVIICSHVLEHIIYPQKLLEDIKKVMVPDKSLLIIAIPNLLVYKNRLKILFGKFNYEEEGLMDYTHVRWYTFKSIKNLLLDAGFIIEKTWVDGGIPFQSYLNFLSENQKASIKKMLFSISKGFFGSEIFCIAKFRELN